MKIETKYEIGQEVFYNDMKLKIIGITGEVFDDEFTLTSYELFGLVNDEPTRLDIYEAEITEHRQ